MADIVALRPLASVGAFVFDCELGSSQGSTREYSTRRIPTGESVIDHSVLNPGGQVFTITGRISNLIQPQNIGRPSPNAGLPGIDDVLGQVLGTSSRINDLLADLEGVIGEGVEVEVVGKKIGKINAVITSWQVQDSASDSGGSTVQVTLLRISRATGLTFINPTELGLVSNGSGNTTDLGPTSLVPQTINVTP